MCGFSSLMHGLPWEPPCAIRFTENTFISFDNTPVLNARGADGLVFKGNEILHSTSYPRHREGAGHLTIEHCSRFDLEACAEISTGAS
jgi:hypothetical protein